MIVFVFLFSQVHLSKHWLRKDLTNYLHKLANEAIIWIWRGWICLSPWSLRECFKIVPEETRHTFEKLQLANCHEHEQPSQRLAETKQSTGYKGKITSHLKNKNLFCCFFTLGAEEDWLFYGPNEKVNCLLWVTDWLFTCLVWSSKCQFVSQKRFPTVSRSSGRCWR